MSIAKRIPNPTASDKKIGIMGSHANYIISSPTFSRFTPAALCHGKAPASITAGSACNPPTVHLAVSRITEWCKGSGR